MPETTACECKNWAEIGHRVSILTGHHSRCPQGGDPLHAACKLIEDLTKGIEAWAREEDGVPDCVWQAYRKAKAMQGVFMPEQSVSRGFVPDRLGTRCTVWTHKKKFWCLETATHEFRDKRSKRWHRACKDCASWMKKHGKIVRKIKR